MITLAINNGGYEGWSLKEYKNIKEVISAIKKGGTYGLEWKVFKELEITIKGRKKQNENT